MVDEDSHSTDLSAHLCPVLRPIKTAMLRRLIRVLSVVPRGFGAIVFIACSRRSDSGERCE